jgi:hypothetical protein
MLTKTKQKLLFAGCLVAACLQGWIVLRVYALVWLAVFGIPGSILFVLINGPHGDTEGLPGVIGGILYVLANGAFYYWLVRQIQNSREKRRNRRTPSLG